MKQVDTYTYVSALRKLTEEGKTVSLRVAGSSMSPFLIHQRDTVTFQKPTRPLKAGDIVFYQRENQDFVLHRICRIGKDGYDIAGDNQTEIEGSVKENQIFAVVIQVQRKGKVMKPGDFWWEFFAHVWIRIIPLRRWINRFYAKWIYGRRKG